MDASPSSSTVPMPADHRWRRLVLIALFLGLLWFFRHLAPVLVCFVVLERALGWAADMVERRTKIHRTGAIAMILTVIASAIGVGSLLAAQRLLPLVRTLRTEGREHVESIARHPTLVRLEQALGVDAASLGEQARAHALTAVKYATATAYVGLYLLMGFVLAIIYLFERKEVDAWARGVPSASILGTLVRWLSYVADAIAITVRLQVIVAIVNAVVTLPVLLALRLPNVPLLFLLILVSGLLPVVGNAISGLVLCVVAYLSRGAWAVGVFLGVTFVLHKVESYYLNPRLAAQHVRLPGLLLVVSLLLFEHAFGFVGLFLSFPALYVASRIAHEWRSEAEPSAAAAREPAQASPPPPAEAAAPDPAE